MADDGAAVDPDFDASAEVRLNEPAAAADVSTDPIVQMFIDAEPASPAATPNGPEPADVQDASPTPEQTQFPAWLVGEDGKAQTAGHAATDAELGDTDVVPVSPETEPLSEAAVDEDAALFEAETMPEAVADAEADMGQLRGPPVTSRSTRCSVTLM